MKTTLSSRELIEISAYLDRRLSSPELIKIQQRLKEDADFRRLARELEHTRTLLRALPVKRAPRNFTLSQQYAKAQARRWGFPSFMGLASAATALAVVALFVGVNFLGRPASKSAVPANLALPEAALSDSAVATGSTDTSPMIITWNDSSQVRGMGGGGEAPKENLMGGYGGGPAATAVPVAVPMAVAPPETTNPSIESQPAATEAQTASMAATPDPSTLILGLPEPGTGGQEINAKIPAPVHRGISLPASTIWMIGLGILSLASGVIAILFRRR